MTPRQFLLLGGIILVVLALAGFTVLGPDAETSMLGDFFYLDMAENVAHLALGVVALAAYKLLKDDKMVRMLVIVVGVVALLVALLGFLNAGSTEPNLGVSNMENPSDNILHLVVAVWALGVAFMKSKATSTAAPATNPPAST